MTHPPTLSCKNFFMKEFRSFLAVTFSVKVLRSTIGRFLSWTHTLHKNCVSFLPETCVIFEEEFRSFLAVTFSVKVFGSTKGGFLVWTYTLHKIFVSFLLQLSVQC